MRSFDVVIVGAGHAGAQAAIALRRMGFAGSIALIGEETRLPYERPPLSKEFLRGDTSVDVLIRPAAFWTEQSIDLLPGERVVAVDPEERHVKLETGERLRFDKLIWATGGKPRRLPDVPSQMQGIHYLRNREDADAIAEAAAEARHIVIIGAGYIGLEAAACLTNESRAVTVLEVAERVLSRVAGEDLSRFYEAEHRARGVDIRLATRLVSIEFVDDIVAAVQLDDGSTLPADMIIVGIGTEPNVSALIDAGAQGAAGGVLVDQSCQTGLRGIYAIGDCAAHTNAFAVNQVTRLESVQNANDQAATAAAAIIGGGTAYHALPWFWSDQFDLKLQTLGLSAGHDATVVRGNMAERSFSIAYFKDNRLIALDCVNAGRDFVQGRALITSGRRVDLAQLANPEIPLKSLLLDAPVEV